MKDSILLLVLALVAVGGLAFLVIKYNAFETSSPRVSSLEPAEAVPPPPSPKAAKPSPKSSKHLLPSIEEPAPAPLSLVPAIAKAVPPAPKAETPSPKLFPTPGQIRIGAEKSSVTAAFGQPTLSATGTKRGHMSETLVYSRDSGHTITMIYVEDGKVRSAYSAPATN